MLNVIDVPFRVLVYYLHSICFFQIKRGEKKVPAKIISCTGNADDLRPRLLANGADLVWDKPFPNAGNGSLKLEVLTLLGVAVDKTT